MKYGLYASPLTQVGRPTKKKSIYPSHHTPTLLGTEMERLTQSERFVYNTTTVLPVFPLLFSQFNHANVHTIFTIVCPQREDPIYEYHLINHLCGVKLVWLYRQDAVLHFNDILCFLVQFQLQV